MLPRKLESIAQELRRKGNTPSDKVLRIAQRGIWSLNLSPHVNLGKRVIVDLDAPPEPPKGMLDLAVRRAELRDVPALTAVVGSDAGLFRERLERGDYGYVAELDGGPSGQPELVCYTWFHRGPTPFEEERTLFAPWRLDASTFWSYDAMTREDVRSSGTFAKVFRIALRELFERHGAKRIRGNIDHVNDASLQVHRRLGFRTIGTVTSVVVPGLKWLLWEGDGVKPTQRVLPRGSDFALAFPLS